MITHILPQEKARRMALSLLKECEPHNGSHSQKLAAIMDAMRGKTSLELCKAVAGAARFNEQHAEHGISAAHRYFLSESTRRVFLLSKSSHALSRIADPRDRQGRQAPYDGTEVAHQLGFMLYVECLLHVTDGGDR
jgi:hypothetical protein